MNLKYKANNEIIGRNLELWSPIETLMLLCEVDIETIKNVKLNFINRNKNSKSTLSSSDWAVIDKVLYLMGENETMLIPTKDIAISLDFEVFDDEENARLEKKSQYVGNIIKRLNLFSGKKHDKSGNLWYFKKVKVEEVRDAYSSEEKSSIPIDTERSLEF